MKTINLFLTYVLFILTCIFTLFGIAFIVSAFIIIKYLFPIIFSIVFTGLFILLTIHYYKCIKLLKHNQLIEKRRILRIENTNIILAAIFGFNAFTMLIVSLFPIIALGGWVDVCLYFIIIGVVCVLYTINLVTINKVMYNNQI